MNKISENQKFENWQKYLLLLFALFLALVLNFVRVGINSESSLENLARGSLQPEIALANGKPTIIEFYADWCEVCREMAPAMITLEEKSSESLNFVFLNVDNQKWQDLVDFYEVTGIPQLNFFNSQGTLKGRSLGSRSLEQLESITNALIKEQDIPDYSGVGDASKINSL